MKTLKFIFASREPSSVPTTQSALRLVWRRRNKRHLSGSQLLPMAIPMFSSSVCPRLSYKANAKSSLAPILGPVFYFHKEENSFLDSVFEWQVTSWGKKATTKRCRCVAKVRKASCCLNANQALCVHNQTRHPHTQDDVGLTSAEIRSALRDDDDSKHMELITWINNPT